MILKSYELKKSNLNLKKFFLFYGKNEGLKNEILDILIKDKNKISNYEEKEILDNENNFIENILSKSLFEKKNLLLLKELLIKF
jgi:DNA polymerase-3 subunit delta